MARIQTTDRRIQRVKPAVRSAGAPGLRRTERDDSSLEIVARLRSATLLEPTHRILRGR